MKAVTRNAEILQRLCKQSKSWGIYFNHTNPDLDNYEKSRAAIMKSAPWLKYLDSQSQMEAFTEGRGFLLFKDKEELDEVYGCTVSDDNRKGKLPSIYMLTCDPRGQLRTENT